MAKSREDLTGQIFGRLTVIEQAEDYITPKGKRVIRWLCKCNCSEDKYTIVYGARLKNHSTLSCGCLQREKSTEALKKANKKCNDYEIQEDYVIMYTSKGEPFFVDLEDFWRVKDICWSKDSNGYLIGGIGNNKNVRLHRYVMDAPPNSIVDHIHGEESKNDNRKNNLRIGSRSQNAMNCGLSQNNTSGCTGVSWDKNRKKWIVGIKVNRKAIYLGGFENFEDAVKARKQAEEKYFCEWSYDNSQNIDDVIW